MNDFCRDSVASAIARADQLRAANLFAEALIAYQDAVASLEIVDAATCVKIARCASRVEQPELAWQWYVRVVDAPDDAVSWQAASKLIARLPQDAVPPMRRTIRVAILGSYTTTQYTELLRLAAYRFGMAVETYECDYGQYQQEIIDPSSGLYAFEPDVVVLATHAGAIPLAMFSDDAEAVVAEELQRWRTLWETLNNRCDARVIMHNIAIPFETPFGHLSTRLPGSRSSMLGQLNLALGQAAGNGTSIVDCDRIAATFGKDRWFDDRYWHMSKQAVALEALPALARHTSAVIAADQGLGCKCLVLDLDNTLWGGVIGEAGVNGIGLGSGAVGESFVQFQQFIRQLKDRGIILAVCSKNNDADAREPFEKHPDMVLSLDDIAMFVANWEPKPQNIRHIAKTLNIGLDAMMFIDDNPAEREIVRQMIPEVEVLTLPPDPLGYTRALARSPFLETPSFTTEDSQRTGQYRGRAEVARLQAGATSMEDFHRSLAMRGVVAPFDEMHLPRIVQLIGKTNQFNLTTRRHTMSSVEKFVADPKCVHLYLKLTDKFADHGLVSLAIAHQDGAVLDIDTWLMSCRVIGRTVEAEMLAYLCLAAAERGCTSIRGTYIPTAKNGLVADVFSRFEFEMTDESDDGTTVWTYDLAGRGPITNGFIETGHAKPSAEETASTQEPTRDAA